jgi:hypothetical protein
VHDEVGKLIRIGADQVDKPAKWASIPQKRDISFDSAFPFIITAPEIDHTHHLTRDEVELGTDTPEKPDKPDKPDKPKHDAGDDDGGKNTEGQHLHRVKPLKKWREAEEHKRRRRSTASEEHSSPGMPFSIGIGIGGGFGGGHHGGGSTPSGHGDTPR